LAVGALILATVIVICLAAYKIKAQTFEFSTLIMNFVSLTIKITAPGMSARKHDPDPDPVDAPPDSQ